MEPADIDRRLNRALERLPTPRAPETLVARVMAAVEARSRLPWYRREWRSWPVGWQVVSGAAGLALVALMVVSSPSNVTVSTDAVPRAGAVTSQVEPTVAALQILWRVVVEPFVPTLFVLAILMGVAVVAIGLTLNYVVLGRTWQR